MSEILEKELLEKIIGERKAIQRYCLSHDLNAREAQAISTLNTIYNLRKGNIERVKEACAGAEEFVSIELEILKPGVDQVLVDNIEKLNCREFQNWINKSNVSRQTRLIDTIEYISYRDLHTDKKYLEERLQDCLRIRRELKLD